MVLLKPRWNVLFLFLFMLLSICRLAAEYLGYQHFLPPAILLMWLSLSIGVIFTLYDMRELYAYNVVSECLQCRFGWRDLSIVKLLLFLIVAVSAVCAARDMWIRWNTAHLNWAVHYPRYFQLSLSVGSSLYLVFILLQGLYLSAVALRMDKEMASEYIEEERARQRFKDLLLINAIFLVYNIIWAFTLILKESITYVLSLNVFALGTFGLIAFHIVSIFVVWIFLLTDLSEPAATMDEVPIQIPKHPPEHFLCIFRVLYFTFIALRILQWSSLHLVLETTALLLLFLAFLVVGIIFVGCKIWLVWKFIVVPNVPLLANKYEVKHWPRVVLIALTMISSLVVIIHLGKDLYDLWQPLQQAMLFQCFLGVYVVAHMVLVLFEGLVAIGLLLFEDIIPYHGQDSAQMRFIARQVHTKCCEASGVFSICSVLFVFGLPHRGFNISTLVKLLGGPSLFHLVIAITYFKFQESCLKQPEQQHHEVQRSQTNESVHSIRKEPWQGAKLLVDRFPYRSLVLFYTFLFLLSTVRWILVQGTKGSQTPTLLQTVSTYVIWLAYQVVCYHWLYVMVVYLSCLIVIKRSFFQIWQTVQECSVLNYPKSVLFGIISLAIVALAIVSEVLRCNLSTSKWAYHDWSPVLGYPLMLVHATALTCQGLLLCGACIASDTTRDTREGENVPWFHDSFGYLLVINVFLLVEHALFISYTNTDILEPLAFGLLVYHAGSCCIIVVLLHTQQEIAVPSDAASSARNDCTGVCNLVWLRMEQLLSPCFKVCHLIRSEPVKGTFYLIYIMAVLSIARVVDRWLSIPNMYSTALTIVFRCFTSFTFAVANYYIWKFLTNSAMYHNQTARRRQWSRLTCSFLVVIVFLGVAEISCTVIYQMTLNFAIENVALDLSLLIVGFMNIVLVLHEGYAIFLLAIQKVCIGRSHSDNASKIIELILTLNLFYAAYGVFNSILAWASYKYSSPTLESIVDLVGHMACSVLVPAMVFPVIERMRENMSLDIQPVVAAEYMGETAEHGSQESSGITSAPTECQEDQSGMY